jgi:RNA polymerase sigma-70 factor (ECF subfamily)
VFRAAYALCGDRELAQDATQEAFARALSRWRRLRGERWAAGWVMTTALNVARRSLRRGAPPPEPEPTPTVSHPDVEMLLDLRVAVRALPRRQQTAVVLYYLAGLPVAEVAGTMGCREGTVRAHLAKARTSLARDLGDLRSPRPRPAGGE